MRPAFIIQLNQRDVETDTPPRLGFTTTRKLGNAVIRNRIRRRLKEAARLSLPPSVTTQCDYVIIGRPAAATISFELLQQEMRDGLRKLHHLVDKKRIS